MVKLLVKKVLAFGQKHFPSIKKQVSTFFRQTFWPDKWNLHEGYGGPNLGEKEFQLFQLLQYRLRGSGVSPFMSCQCPRFELVSMKKLRFPPFHILFGAFSPFGRAPAPCKRGGARAGAGGTGFCGSACSTFSQIKPVSQLSQFRMEPLHLHSIWQGSSMTCRWSQSWSPAKQTLSTDEIASDSHKLDLDSIF